MGDDSASIFASLSYGQWHMRVTVSKRKRTLVVSLQTVYKSKIIPNEKFKGYNNFIFNNTYLIVMCLLLIIIIINRCPF